MRISLPSRRAATLVATALLLAGIAAPAQASDNEIVDELLSLNPGLTEAELLAEASDYVADSEESLDEVLEQALDEAREAERENDAEQEELGLDGSMSTMSSGGKGPTYLGKGRQAGDVYYVPAGTLIVIRHGHSGIYYTDKVIVEAPGVGKVSRSANAANIEVVKGAKKQEVKATAAQRTAAGKYAYDKLRNKKYNAAFATNKKGTGKRMNCSQLVWAAYMETSKIDLDGNGGGAVCPKNIVKSDLTTTYKTFK